MKNQYRMQYGSEFEKNAKVVVFDITDESRPRIIFNITGRNARKIGTSVLNRYGCHFTHMSGGASEWREYVTYWEVKRK